MKKVIAAILSIAAIALPQAAIAQTTQANKDSLGNIIVSGTGLTPGTLIKVYYPQVFDQKNFTATGACSLLTISKSSSFQFVSSIKINGTTMNLSQYSIPPLSGSPCVNGVPNPAYAWITAGSYKYIQATESKVFVTGATGSVQVTSDATNFRLGKVDSCGRISIKNSVKWPTTGLNLGDGTFSYAVGNSYGPDLPVPATVTEAMPICRKGTLYRRFAP